MSKKRRVFPMTVQCGSVRIKIYKVQNKGRDSFTVSYHANGNRQLQMFADFEEAHVEATAKARSMANGELDVLELRSADRNAYIHAQAFLRPTGVSLELAAKEYAEAWKILQERGSLIEAAKDYARRQVNELPNKLVPDAVKEMLESKEREHTSAAYMKVLRCYLNQLAGAFQCQLRSLSTAQLSDFLRLMDVGARSKNNARATVGAFFKYCYERGWLPKDHEGISVVPKFRETPSEIQIFTPNEIEQFLTHCRPELVPFLAIGAFAGLRSAEIGRLDWSEVNLDDRLIEIKAAKAKTASRRIVPILDNLAKWLRPHAKQSGRVVPFDNVNKQIGWLVDDTNETLTGAAKEGKHPEPFKPLRWKKNALRHSYISYRVADIQDVNQVALECGTSPAIIFKHYRELVRPAAAKKWFFVQPPAADVLNPEGVPGSVASEAEPSRERMADA